MKYGIILAGGSGKRAGTEIPKQYVEVNGKPLLYYSLKAFEESSVDRVCIVADAAHLRYVLSEIVDKYNFKKVVSVCEGGAERFDSVFHGLDDLYDEVMRNRTNVREFEKVQSEKTGQKDLTGKAFHPDIVLIHDGARPFVTPALINEVADAVLMNGAAIAAVPVKDTIKIGDAEGFVECTTERAKTWAVQTPQGFEYGRIYKAYAAIAEKYSEGRASFTDDSMVWERCYPDIKVKLVASFHENMKITTNEDFSVANSRLV